MFRSLATAGLSMAVLILAGCASADNKLAKESRTPDDLYHLQALDQSDQIMLAVHAEGLSAAQKDALAALAGRWREGGARAVQINAPRGLVDSVAVRFSQLRPQGAITASKRVNSISNGALGSPAAS